MLKKVLNSTWLITVIAVLGLVLAACGNTSGTTPPVVESQAASVSAQVTVATGDQASGESIVKLNLNTATGEEFLAAIPGLGNRMVREFEEYRPYVSIQQFRREIGKYVDEAQVAEYEKYVFVPISVNDADSETLQQIPGLDDSEADALIAKRPFASNDAFLAELTQYISEAELTAAQTYLAP